MVKRLRFCSDIEARESHILDRSDWESAPRRHANCVNTIIELLRVHEVIAPIVVEFLRGLAEGGGLVASFTG